METFYIAAIANIGLGILLLFFGLRFMKLAIGALGALSGFWLGSILVSQLNWNGAIEFVLLMGTVVLLASVAVRFYKFLVRASISLTIFSILYAVGIELGVSIIASLILALLAAIIAFVAIKALHLIDLLFVFATATNGAGYLLSGIALLLNPTNISVLNHGQLHALMNQSPFWIIAWVVLAIAGMSYQGQRRTAVESAE